MRTHEDLVRALAPSIDSPTERALADYIVVNIFKPIAESYARDDKRVPTRRFANSLEKVGVYALTRLNFVTQTDRRNSYLADRITNTDRIELTPQGRAWARELYTGLYAGQPAGATV